ncbi:MAG: HNH endonuclease, partial [Lachnospiraceae bacterium]|nr:HNH endonuclease [Lachnospiraceae bacterium]
PRDGRSKGIRGGSPTKITDKELLEEVKTLTCAQIATKHGMSLSRVYRRAKNLGIEDQLHGGGGNWRKRMYFYSAVNDYDDSITLKRVVDKYCGICQICGKLIDWNAISGKHIRRMYPTVDHIIPLSRGGSHTWDNVQLAHMMCNAGKCDR